MSDPSSIIDSLSPRQRELLLLRMRSASREKTQEQPIARRSRAGVPLPLSFAQRRLWFLDKLEPGGAAYVIPHAVRVSGSLSLDVLERVMTEVVRRHETLRTVITVVDEEPVQMIQPPEPVKIPFVDLSGRAPEDREDEVRR